MNDRIVSYISYHPVRTQRGLEILTGLIPWSIILFPFVGSFFIPEVVAYFVIAFNVYWLYRSWQMVIYAISGYLNIRATTKINWLKTLQENPKTIDRYKNVKQAIILCNYKDSFEILDRNLQSIVAGSFPLKQIYIFLAIEDREGEPALKRSELLKEKYKNTFARFETTIHKLTPEETIGKHSNETHSAKEITRIMVNVLKIKLEDIIVTTSDADSVFHKDYYSLLAYKFLTNATPHQDFYQAPLFMYNNINRVPLMVRVPSIISGIYFLSVLHKQSKRFLNYSTYSMSLKLLVDVGYWDVDVIPEDAHIFFKTYFALRGKTNVIPVFTPISIDAIESVGRITSLKNSYEQNKRWAWGAVDIPYVVKNFFIHSEIPLWDRLIRLSVAIEWHFVWSSYWFLLTIGANIPTVINPVFARTTLGLNLSRMSSTILTLSLAGIITVVFIDILLNPNYKSKLKTLLHPFTYLQWLILPITGFFFGSLPGLESQTRLMLGKYIEYRVAEKVIK